VFAGIGRTLRPVGALKDRTASLVATGTSTGKSSFAAAAFAAAVVVTATSAAAPPPGGGVGDKKLDIPCWPVGAVAAAAVPSLMIGAIEGCGP